MANLLDVIVNIDIKQNVGLDIELGKPLIIAEMTTAHAYKEYESLEAVKADFTGSSTEETKIKAMAEAIFSQENKPKKIAIATCVAAEEGAEEPALVTLLNSVYDRDWYYLLCIDNTQSTIIDLSDVIETKKRKMYVTRTSTASVLAAVKETAIASTTNTDRTRTIVFFHETADEYADAGLVGECGGQTVGSITWKFKTIKGLTAGSFSQSEVDDIHDDGGICYVTKAGDNITSEGIVNSGEFIDVVNAMDWIQFNVERRVQKLFNSNPKIPYTNGGIAMIENEVISVLQTAHANGIVANDSDGLPEYSTNFPGRDATTSADRQSRAYNLGSFEATLEGAIHSTVLRGYVSY